jgi:hypothetical protein
MLTLISGIAALFCTIFMVFLHWLAKNSKDPLARKLRVFGDTGTLLLWVVTVVLIFLQ